MYIGAAHEGWTIMAMAVALSLADPDRGPDLHLDRDAVAGAAAARAVIYALRRSRPWLSGSPASSAYFGDPGRLAARQHHRQPGRTLYVLVGGGVIGGFAALHYWFPKLSGRLLGEGVGEVALGLARRAPPLRAADVPRRARGPAGRRLQVLRGHRRRRLQPDRLDRRLRARVRGFLELGNAAHSWNRTARLAATTRGAAPRSSGSRSPPPPHNFDAVPDVRSAEPLADIRGTSVRRTGRRQAAGALLAPRRPTVARRRWSRRRQTRTTAARWRSPSGERTTVRFRRLVTLTIVATFVLILIGGIVRVSDSGLGCGPRAAAPTAGRCARGRAARGLVRVDDRVQPPGRRQRRRRPDRAAALACACAACAPPWLVRGSIAAGVLVLAQAALGGLTVEEGLEDELVAAHLGLAMLLLGLLIAAPRGVRRSATAPVEASRAAHRRPLAAVAGAGDDRRRRLRRRHRERGHPGEPVVGQPTRRAATGFPALPRPASCRSASRAWSTSSSPIARSCTWPRSRCSRWPRWRCAAARPSRAFGIASLILVAQIALGALNVWAGKHAGLILGHLALGTILWSTVVYAGRP